MSKLKPCPFYGVKNKDCMGYDFHKVSCSNDFCVIGGIAMAKEQWNTRTESDTITQLKSDRAELLVALNAIINSKFIELIICGICAKYSGKLREENDKEVAKTLSVAWNLINKHKSI